MIDELRQMAIFAKTVEQGSFRAAGQVLRLSPSVVSHHIGQLEQRIGTPLLYRSTRRLSLTEDGKKLLTAALAMLDAAENGLKHISRDGETLMGSLRLTVPALLNNSALYSHVAAFSRKHEGVTICIDSSDTRRDIIADGYDVAIAMGPIKSSSLKTRHLFTVERVLVTSPEYADQKRTPVSPSDLTHWTWLELSQLRNEKTAFQNAEHRYLLSKRNHQFSVNDANALVGLVCAGAGIALLPLFLVQDYIQNGRLTTLLNDWTVPSQEVFAVWPPNVTANGVVTQFVQYLEESMTDREL